MSQPRPATTQEQIEFSKTFGNEVYLLSVEMNHQKHKIYTFSCKKCGSTSTRYATSCRLSKRIGTSICTFCNKNNGKRRSDEDLFSRVETFCKTYDISIDNLNEIIQHIQNKTFHSFSVVLLKSNMFPILTTKKTISDLLHRRIFPFWLNTYRGSIQKAIYYYLFYNILRPDTIEDEVVIHLPSGRHRIDYKLRIGENAFFVEAGFYHLRRHNDLCHKKTTIYIDELRRLFGSSFVELYREEKTFDQALFDKRYYPDTRLGYMRTKIEVTARQIIDAFAGKATLHYTSASDATDAVFDDLKHFYHYYTKNVRPIR